MRTILSEANQLKKRVSCAQPQWCCSQFRLAVNAHATAVQEGHNHQRDTDPRRGVNVGNPVADQDGDRTELRGEKDGPEVPCVR